MWNVRPSGSCGRYILSDWIGAAEMHETPTDIERMVEAENMRSAWGQVESNRGARGLDGRDVDDTAALFRKSWTEIRRGTWTESGWSVCSIRC